MKKYSLLLSILILSGCVNTTLPDQDKPYDPESNARIRLYGQNGKQSTMQLEVNGKQTTISVGGGFGDSISSMVGAVSNLSIGIPETRVSKDIALQNGILSKTFYREFIIPAGKPIKVTNHISDLDNRSTDYYTGTITVTTMKGCNGKTITFTPEAGKDYEVAPISYGAQCGVSVLEIK